MGKLPTLKIANASLNDSDDMYSYFAATIIISLTPYAVYEHFGVV